MKITTLQAEDIPGIVRTFTFPWTTLNDTQEKWKQYFEEQQKSDRMVCLAKVKDKWVGYGSLLRVSAYPHFEGNNIPEIHDVWIAEDYRGKGFGKRLVQHLELLAHQKHYQKIGIGVGLYKDNGRAQQLYVQLGYVPDGRGVTYKYQSVVPGDSYPVDDDLVIWLKKDLP
jgi:GNAT superfamily N-acetyltransferase